MPTPVYTRRTAAAFAIGAALATACATPGGARNTAGAAPGKAGITAHAARAEAGPGEAASAAGAEGRERSPAPGFAEAVAAYERHVRLLRRLPETLESDGVRRALLLLANAIEKIPQPGPVDVRQAAETIRTDEVRIALALPAEDDRHTRATTHALEVASDAMLALARGPYRSDEAVMARVADLDRAIATIRRGARLRTHRGDVLEALERASSALGALLRGKPARS